MSLLLNDSTSPLPPPPKKEDDDLDISDSLSSLA